MERTYKKIEIVCSADTGFGEATGFKKTAVFLFQLDALLSGQYLETVRRKARSEPEEKLMMAVLGDAVACFREYIFARDSRRKNLFREAEEWILVENSDLSACPAQTDSFFSFENVCEVLGFNSTCLRNELLRWKERKLAGSSKTETYCWTRQGQEHKRGVVKSGRTEQRSRRAPARWRFCSQGVLKS
jgi:hypothetical protein